MKRLFQLALLSAFVLNGASSALAADEHHHHGSASASASSSASAPLPMTDGEIKKVDKSGGKLTIKHGPIVNLDMPGMTMIFKVKDPAMLDQVKSGDKVRFTVEKVKGALTVTKLEAAK